MGEVAKKEMDGSEERKVGLKRTSQEEGRFHVLRTSASMSLYGGRSEGRIWSAESRAEGDLAIWKRRRKNVRRRIDAEGSLLLPRRQVESRCLTAEERKKGQKALQRDRERR